MVSCDGRIMDKDNVFVWVCVFVFIFGHRSKYLQGVALPLPLLPVAILGESAT